MVAVAVERPLGTGARAFLRDAYHRARREAEAGGGEGRDIGGI